MDFGALLDMSPYHLFLCILLLAPTLLLLQLGCRRKAVDKEGHLRLPPGPKGWPIVGNLLDLDAKEPHIVLANLARSIGPMISLRFGSRLAIVASTPAAAKEIYRFHDREISGRLQKQLVKNMEKLSISSITVATECNEQWRFLRKLSHSELFSSQAIESQSKVRFETLNQMLKYLSSRKGQVVNIGDAIFGTMANTISRVMASHDVVESLEKVGEIQTLIGRLIKTASPGLSDLYPAIAGTVLDFSMKRRVAASVEITRSLWFEPITKRRMQQQQQSDGPNQDFLGALIRLSWDDIQICNLLTEFLASTESMTVAVEWAMAELIRNQEALSKLRKELAETMKDGVVLKEGNLSKLPFLQACIKETFRLHPPSPFLVPREVVEKCKMLGYDIPKGSLVVINAYALGRDANAWEDPLSFNPERFEGTIVDVKGSNYELLPFGGGRRICIGYPLALKQIQLVLASIVHVFDWSLPEGTDSSGLDMSEVFGITLKKKIPLQLVLTKRNDLKIEI